MTDGPKKKVPTQKQLDALKANKASNWEKGASGNPAGRPAGLKNHGTNLKKYMDVTFKSADGKTHAQPFGLEGEKLTVEEMIDLAALKQALAGKLEAIKMVKEFVYGKQVQPTEMSGPDGGPVKTENTDIILTAAERKAKLIAEATARGLPTTFFDK